MSKKTIVHTEMLAPYTRLEIRLHDVPEPDKYTFSIVYLDEQGQSQGHSHDGQWYETQAACIAGAIIEYASYHKIDD